MADEDVQVTSDDEGQADDGSDVAIAGLPPYVDAIIKAYEGQFGRVVSRKLVRAKGTDRADRDRLVVTYENGESKRKAVTFKIGHAARAADPADKTDQGSEAETTIVESVEDVKAPTKPREPAARQAVVLGPDGKNHIMEADATGAYTIDRGLAPNQPTPEKPKPSDPSKWRPIPKDPTQPIGPNNPIVAVLDPETGERQAVTQKDPKDPQVFQTKDGHIITVSPDGSTAHDVTPPNPNEKAPPAGLDYVPDDTAPDGGLVAYNRKLMDAHRAGEITFQMGIDLLARAGKIYEAKETGRSKRAGEASTTRAQDISQRGQDLDEVQSRRSSADGQFGKVFDNVSKYGATLIPGPDSGQTVVDAYRAMLDMARDNADEAGGYADVPQVPATGVAPIPGSESTQLVFHPGGRVEFSPAGAAPPEPATPLPASPSGPGAAGSGEAASPNVKEDRGPSTPVNPPAGEPGNDPTRPVGLVDSRSQVESLVAMGFDPAEAQNIASLYARGVRGDHL